MKHELVPRFVSACIIGLLFAFIPWLFSITKTAVIEHDTTSERRLYNTVILSEFLDATFTAQPVDLGNGRAVETVFSRTAPFDIPTKQITEIRAFCDGETILMRRREPISILVNAGKREVVVSYNLDTWGIGKVPDPQDCSFVISKQWEMELPYGIMRTMELKAVFTVK